MESPLDIDRSRDKRRSQDILINLKQEKKEKKLNQRLKEGGGWGRRGKVKKLAGYDSNNSNNNSIDC